MGRLAHAVVVRGQRIGFFVCRRHARTAVGCSRHWKLLGLEQFIQRLLEIHVCTTKTGENCLGPDKVALNALLRPVGWWQFDQAATVVKLIGQLDQLGALCLFRRVGYLQAFALVLW